MRKYKIGDKIKLKPYNESFNFDGDGPWSVDEMIPFFGKEQEISYIYTNDFNIKNDEDSWLWNYNWIE